MDRRPRVRRHRVKQSLYLYTRRQCQVLEGDFKILAGLDCICIARHLISEDFCRCTFLVENYSHASLLIRRCVQKSKMYINTCIINYLKYT